MRLIDADATPSMGISNFSVMFQKVIDSMPTVDLWHYPAKGELPKESGVYLVKVNYHDGKASPFMSLCEYDTKYSKWFFYGNKDIVAWQDIYPTSEGE